MPPVAAADNCHDPTKNTTLIVPAGELLANDQRPPMAHDTLVVARPRQHRHFSGTVAAQSGRLYLLRARRQLPITSRVGETATDSFRLHHQ